MKTRTYLIPSWSGRVYKARKNYCCDLCEGIIPRGVSYVRDVVRDGPNWGIDPLRNIHKHHNCETPWWQVAPHPRRLKHVGRLPHRLPTPAEYPGHFPVIVPVLAVSAGDIGTFTWKLPQALEIRLGRCPSETRKIAALSELEDSLSLVLAAFIKASGNQRLARELSLKLGAIAQWL